MGTSEEKTSLMAKGGRIWPYLLIAGGTAVVLVIGAAAFGYLNYRSAPSTTRLAQIPSQVWIDSPQAESIVTIEDLILVQGAALGQDPFVKLELWIDGELVGLDSGPDGGLNPWTSVFSWMPLKPGFHSLVLRAENIHGINSSSPAVVVYVEPNEKFLDGVFDEKQGDDAFLQSSVFPAAQITNDEVESTSPPELANPASIWGGSLGNWVNSLISDSPPDVPGLVVRVDDCSALLHIQDLSSNEEGFNLYRQTLTSPIWTKIASLASQSKHEWLTYEDARQVGGVTYYVSAFNSQGETSSPLQAVSFDPTACEGQSEFQQSVNVEVTKLDSVLAVDKAYCYRSFNGLDWSRWPSSGFFYPGDDGFKLEEHVSAFLQPSLGEESEVNSLEFHIECWGWNSGALEYLGELGIGNLDLDNFETYSLEGGDIKADIAIRAAPTIGHPSFAFTNREDLRDITFKLMHSTVDLNEVGSAAVLPDEIIPSAQRFPYIQAWLTYTKEECFNHLEPESQVAFGTLFLCSPLEGFSEGPGSLNPQPYIIWKFMNTCPAGSYETCLPITWWKEWVEDHKREAFVEIWAENDYRNWSFSHDEIDRTVHRLLPQSCNGERRFRVRIVINRGHDQTWPTEAIETITSRWSNWVHGVRCREPVGDEVIMEVTFDSIQWSHVDDDDLSNPQVIETYGGLWAGTPLTPGVTPHGLIWGPRGYATDYHLRLQEYTETYREDFSDGVVNMASRTLCRELGDIPGFECTEETYPGEEFSTNNNKFFIPVRGGDDILFSVSIRDYDANSANDTVCSVVRRTPTRTLKGWAEANGDVFQLHQPDNGNAECLVTVRLRAVSQ